MKRHFISTHLIIIFVWSMSKYNTFPSGKNDRLFGCFFVPKFFKYLMSFIQGNFQTISISKTNLSLLLTIASYLSNVMYCYHEVLEWWSNITKKRGGCFMNEFIFDYAFR